jgi:hypothetical protein
MSTEIKEIISCHLSIEHEIVIEVDKMLRYARNPVKMHFDSIRVKVRKISTVLENFLMRNYFYTRIVSIQPFRWRLTISHNIDRIDEWCIFLERSQRVE